MTVELHERRRTPVRRNAVKQAATRDRIYLSPPHMSEEAYEFEFVRNAFETNWIAPIGPHVNGFETEFCFYNESENAAALSSGTAALHLALRLLGIKRGDEVLCSTFTFCASANPIVYEGARPVFVDSESKSWNMDPALLAEELERAAKANKLPRAVIAVDLYGQSADYDPLLEVCSRYAIPLIEDAAEALGAAYKGRKTGNFGSCAVFSFNGNKIITGSGGGLLVSDNEKLIAHSRNLSTQARMPAAHYEHEEIGFNYRMSNVIAGILRGQLRVLPRRIERKREIFETYRRELGTMPGIEFMPIASWSEPNYWLTCLTIDPLLFGADRERIRVELERENIESRPLWKPLHLQPVFRECRAIGGDVSESLFELGLCLPSGSALTDIQQERIIGIIKRTGRT